MEGKSFKEKIMVMETGEDTDWEALGRLPFGNVLGSGSYRERESERGKEVGPEEGVQAEGTAGTKRSQWQEWPRRWGTREGGQQRWGL